MATRGSRNSMGSNLCRYGPDSVRKGASWVKAVVAVKVSYAGTGNAH